MIAHDARARRSMAAQACACVGYVPISTPRRLKARNSRPTCAAVDGETAACFVMALMAGAYPFLLGCGAGAIRRG